MKIIFKFITSIAIFFTLSFISCSAINTSSLNHELESKVSPSPTPINSPENVEAKFISEEGWIIPLPERKKKTRVIEGEVISENGKKVKRTITLYDPIGDFLFQRESSTSSSGRQLPSGLLKLESIWEVKIKEKIYSYSITYQETRSNEQTDMSAHGTHLVYRLFDMDGDGKFEMLVGDGSNVLVPEWATQ